MKNIDYPKISVIIPSYNQGKYIERTLLSIIKQDYHGKIEIIVSDGGSTDKTVDILKRYNIIWWSEKDKGFSDAVNKGLKVAGGDIIAIQSSDDYYLQGTFRKVAKYFGTYTEYGFITGNDIAIDSNNKIVRVMLKQQVIASPSYLLQDGYIPQHATFIRKQAIDRVGGLKVTCDQCGDADLFYRILHFYKGLIIRDLFSVYQIHAFQRSKSASHLWIEALQRMFQECENDQYYSNMFRPSAQEKMEHMIFGEILWEYRAGNSESARKQLEDVCADKTILYSEWLNTVLNNLHREITNEKKSFYDKIFKGDIFYKVQNKIRMYSNKCFRRLDWYSQE